MSLIITPGQLSRRAELYYQISQLITAGIGLVAALEQLERHPPSRSFRRPIQNILAKIHEGASFTDALQSTSGWLPQFDIELIHAGERSGRLEMCLRSLSDYYAARAKLMRQMISQLLYPVGLVHFAAVVFLVIVPFAGSHFETSLNGLLLRAMAFLAPLYLGTLLTIFAMQSKHGEPWRALIESSLRFIPLIGGARRDLAMARLSLALEALINSGVSILEAWPMAARASASPAIRRVVATWGPELEVGHTPADLVRRSRVFTDMFMNFYATGEASGRLDESLHRLYEYYYAEGTRKMELLAEWTPRAIYMVIACSIAVYIIKFYTAYFNQVNTITQGF